MSLAYWRDICVLNFPEIDEEHVRLLYILKSIYHDIQLAENTAGIQSKLHELFDTTLTHCETEERLMVIYRYPDYTIHADQHEELLNNVLNLRLRAEDREGSLSLDMIHDLTSWLNQHTWEYDLKLVQFIRQQNYREELLYN